MIGITGASGQLGQLIIQELLNMKVNPEEIVAIARSTEKLEDFASQGVQIRKGDYGKPETLTEALAGIDKLLLISSSEVGQRVIQHQAVISAAKKNAVAFLAYTSILKAIESPLFLAQEHKQTEILIKESGLNYCLLRNGWYSENYTMSISNILSMGAMYGCAGNGKFSTAPRLDYARGAAKVLAEDGHSNKTYELAGDEGFTLADFAKILGEETNKEIPYTNMPAEAFQDVLTKAGLPPEFAQALANSEAEAAQGWLYNDDKELSKLIGRSTESIRTTIKKALES